MVEGKGLMIVDGELLSLERGDIVRVSPAAKRALKAAVDTALFAICAGGVAAGYPKQPNSRYLIDDGIPHYDDIPPWYQDNPEIVERNAQLKERMLKAQLKRAVASNQEKSDSRQTRLLVGNRKILINGCPIFPRLFLPKLGQEGDDL